MVAREDTPGDKRLVAYVVLAPAAGMPTAEPQTHLPPELQKALESHLAVKLPAHMVPSRFIRLDALPLTTSNKVDRKALPAPARVTTGVAGPVSYAEPREALEFKLRAVWEELLGVQGIGIHDNFFELGGHSLLALKLFNRIDKAFGVTLPIASLIQAPNVAGLSSLLRRGQPSWSSLVPIQISGSRPPLFCVHAVGGNVLNYRLLSKYLGEEVPFYGLQARGLGGDEAPHGSVAEMAASYIAEMRLVQARGPYQLGGASSGGVVAYEMAQQLHAMGEPVSTLIFFDTYLVGAPIPRLVQARAASPIHPRALLLDHHFGQLLIRTPREGLDYLIREGASPARRRGRPDCRGHPRREPRRAPRHRGEPPRPCRLCAPPLSRRRHDAPLARRTGPRLLRRAPCMGRPPGRGASRAVHPRRTRKRARRAYREWCRGRAGPLPGLTSRYFIGTRPRRAATAMAAWQRRRCFASRVRPLDT